MANAVTRKNIKITVDISYDPDQIQRIVDLAKLVDVADNIVELFWEEYPVESALLVLSTNQLFNISISQELNIRYSIQPAEGDLMEAQNF